MLHFFPLKPVFPILIKNKNNEFILPECRFLFNVNIFALKKAQNPGIPGFWAVDKPDIQRNASQSFAAAAAK
jgi:hypothetical protein